MKILEFRPYKKMKDNDLLNQIHHTFDYMRTQDIHDDEALKRCDQLIREAKLRRLRCSKENLYYRILYK
ncbi:DNA/RNA-binding domain of Phe-tRNA-synthetase-like protein [Anaerosolibacter carboniphilus]|uniref:DNA/RNA-binding domain of Phe-tRNA-synthetase-like protein n=1 Tax=Anaerosolibacter carboniphilus TaxID=1417629 RepID=A0A841KUL9_9FIRM|nr:hypothetical protein [Anaerosolibacter carboniphilus]MBB6217087.1 DNA/RNA-binding domain of Phe-tRNA-synthetase-like protein [Anaerosolibacter carboniphilus]